MKKYIDAEKLLDIIIKMQKEYATQEVTEEHKGLRAVLGGQCLVLTEIIEIIDSLQQEQPSLPANLYEAAFNYAELCKYDGVDKLLCVEHFKAGAEWMMRQGVKTKEDK